MAVTVVKQFTATIKANSTFVWWMGDCSPGYNRRLAHDADPKWIIYWQAVPIIETADIDAPGIERERLGIEIVEQAVLQDEANLTHRLTLLCKDFASPPVKSNSVLTYALYAVFIDL
jgi:hypothetical protein